MAENTVNLPGPDGNPVPVTPVRIVESTDRFSDVRLENGVVLHVKHVSIEVFRADSLKDEFGRSTYVIKGNTVIVADHD